MKLIDRISRLMGGITRLIRGIINKVKKKESKEKEIKEDATASESASLETFQKLWLFPNVVQVDDLLNLVDIYGDELVNAAIKLAGSKDVPKNRAISFLTASLQEWADANVKTIEQARSTNGQEVLKAKL
ncbi:DnaD domain protein [Enterococcus gallinarum]|nr:DnaD domain protein [Enterococcus gallinarum]